MKWGLGRHKFQGLQEARRVKSLVIYLMGPFIPALIRSMTFSFVGVLVIQTLVSTTHALIPNWEDSLPPHPRLAAEPASSLVTLAQE